MRKINLKSCFYLLMCSTACGPAFTTAVDSLGPTGDAETAIETSSATTPDSTSGRSDASSVGYSTDAGAKVLDDSSGPTKPSDGSQVDGDAATGDGGPMCTPIGDGLIFDSCTLSTNTCVLFATPAVCRCAETYTCECITFHSTSCVGRGLVYVSCTLQSNGVPRVSCQ